MSSPGYSQTCLVRQIVPMLWWFALRSIPAFFMPAAPSSSRSVRSRSSDPLVPVPLSSHGGRGVVVAVRSTSSCKAALIKMRFSSAASSSVPCLAC